MAGVITGQQCSADADCAHVSNSKCSFDVCTCENQMFQYDAATSNCKPKTGVGAFCNSAADCSLYAGSVCEFNNGTATCKCPIGSICQECRLGASCDASLSCTDAIQGWLCTGQAVQVCNASRVKRGDYYCTVRGIGESCFSEEQCAEVNGTCVAGKCQCSHEALVYNSDTIKCSPRQLSQPCSKDSECGFINNATCSGNICACSPPFASKKGNSCSFCYSESDKYENGICTRRVLGDSCSTDTACSRVAYSVCKGGVCSCAPRYGRQTEFSCSYCALGSYCVTGVNCTDVIPHSTCVGNVLKLEYGYCFYASDCAHVTNGDCHNSRCVCQARYTEVSSVCVRTRIADPCPDGTRNCPRNSICSQGVCICTANYRNDGDYACIARNIGDVCNDAANESCGAFLGGACKGGQCACRDAFIYNVATGRCERRVFGSACNSSSQCSHTGGVCLAGQCVCVGPFKLDSTSKCVPNPCTANANCSPGSLCAVSVCNCPTTRPLTQGSTSSCKSTVGTQCVADVDCVVWNQTTAYQCLNSVCRCAKGYRQNGVGTSNANMMNIIWYYC